MAEYVFSDASLKKLKDMEVSMLRECISVCEKLGIKYYLIGGTLLGAVRHGGFIPWDDDIDIAMTRADYEVFVSKAQEFLPNNLFLQTNKTDPEALMNFAKIRNSDTAFIETSTKDLTINHGIFIDIFPLDTFGTSPVFEQLFMFFKLCIRLRVGRGFTPSACKSRFYKRAVNGVLSGALFWMSPKTAVRIREKLFKSVKRGKRLANHSGAWGKKEIVPAEWYGEGTFLEFEGISARCPKDYKKWLERVYGNYMELPPVEKRVSHHYVEVVDLEKSYREYSRMGG